MKKKLFVPGINNSACGGKKSGCHFTELPLSILRKARARKHKATGKSSLQIAGV